MFKKMPFSYLKNCFCFCCCLKRWFINAVSVRYLCSDCWWLIDRFNACLSIPKIISNYDYHRSRTWRNHRRTCLSGSIQCYAPKRSARPAQEKSTWSPGKLIVDRQFRWEGRIQWSRPPCREGRWRLPRGQQESKGKEWKERAQPQYWQGAYSSKSALRRFNFRKWK